VHHREPQVYHHHIQHTHRIHAIHHHHMGMLISFVILHSNHSLIHCRGCLYDDDDGYSGYGDDTGGSCSLADCFREFTRQETLTANEQVLLHLTPYTPYAS
jgi:hypothetical protein